ncbi:MAG: hypothetical protein D6769_03255 [Methanobacteriota archaeon]|nr:MAG: hypothetical protein D6769_03255 [Euryarchaeota archaeon]
MEGNKLAYLVMTSLFLLVAGCLGPSTMPPTIGEIAGKVKQLPDSLSAFSPYKGVLVASTNTTQDLPVGREGNITHNLGNITVWDYIYKVDAPTEQLATLYDNDFGDWILVNKTYADSQGKIINVGAVEKYEGPIGSAIFSYVKRECATTPDSSYCPTLRVILNYPSIPYDNVFILCEEYSFNKEELASFLGEENKRIEEARALGNDAVGNPYNITAILAANNNVCS